ncbi:MAG: Mur ligase family protein [Flavobacterium sp.]
MANLIKKLHLKRRFIATLAEWHFYGNPSKKLKVVGVTGTNGKTTTVTLLYRIATSLGYKAGLIGTVENIIGTNVLPHDDKSPGTTPDPIYLNKLLTQMVEEGCEYVFMEVSSHALDQGRVNGINFAGGIFTNLTHDHLDYHKDLQNYFLAKKKFFDMLPKNAFALSNMDDDHGILMVENIKAKKFLYGFSNKYATPQVKDPKKDTPDPWEYFDGEILKLDFSGLELNINGEKIESKLLGKFNAQNLLAVYSASELLGFDMKKVEKIIETAMEGVLERSYLKHKTEIPLIVHYGSGDNLEEVK